MQVVSKNVRPFRDEFAVAIEGQVHSDEQGVDQESNYKDNVEAECYIVLKSGMCYLQLELIDLVSEEQGEGDFEKVEDNDDEHKEVPTLELPYQASMKF